MYYPTHVYFENVEIKTMTPDLGTSCIFTATKIISYNSL